MTTQNFIQKEAKKASKRLAKKVTDLIIRGKFYEPVENLFKSRPFHDDTK